MGSSCHLQSQETTGEKIRGDRSCSDILIYFASDAGHVKVLLFSRMSPVIDHAISITIHVLPFVGRLTVLPSYQPMWQS